MIGSRTHSCSDLHEKCDQVGIVNCPDGDFFQYSINGQTRFISDPVLAKFNTETYDGTSKPLSAS